MVKAIEEMESGLIDAALGCNLFKKRIAKSGMGKRGAYRTIVACKQAVGWVFMFGFEKNEIANIDKSSLLAYKKYVDLILFPEFDKLVKANILLEVKNGK